MAVLLTRRGKADLTYCYVIKKAMLLTKTPTYGHFMIQEWKTGPAYSHNITKERKERNSPYLWLYFSKNIFFVNDERFDVINKSFRVFFILHSFITVGIYREFR